MTSILPPDSNDQNPAATAAQLVQELLDRVIRASEADSAQVESPLGGSKLAETLRRLIDEVREEYRLIADREVTRALEAALGIEISLQAQSTNSTRTPAEPNVLDALEALIMGANDGFLPNHEHDSESLTASGQHGDAGAQPQVEETLYEGTVRLYVNADGNMQRVIRFVDDIGQRPQFRVLRMTGSPQSNGAEIDLGLRESTAFLELLRSMGHAAEPIGADDGGVPQINVRLHGLVTA
jgi:hypothetical protein